MIKFWRLLFFFNLWSLNSLLFSQILFQTDFPAEEFAERRAKIFESIGDEAVALIQGAPAVQGFYTFRQSNTFYYLCGLEVPQAYLLLDGRNRRTTLFLPKRDERMERHEGKVLSAEDAELVKELTGVDQVLSEEKMSKHLALGFSMKAPHPVIYTPHSPAIGHLQGRDEVLKGLARQYADPWDGRPSRTGHFIKILRERFPQLAIKDLSPILGEMRAIKSKREIDLIRKASELAGEAIAEAIRSTKPGVMEYQLDAAANFVFSTNGARSESYRSITAGGENAWMGHYFHHTSVVKDGDLVLMDIAPDYRYYTSDVTRMWPVSGTYSKDQRDLYGFMVSYRNALLNHIRPGMTVEEVNQKTAEEMRPVFDKIEWSKEIYRKGAEAAFNFKGHLSHPVGMSVHDIGYYRKKPLAEGMVFAIDPMIWIPEEKLYIRMEDVVVVTADGVENLSDTLVSEMDDIEALMKEEGIVQKRPAIFD